MIENRVKRAIRVYGQFGRELWRDFEALGTRIDISPDGSMLLTNMSATGETRLNPQSGKLEDALVVRILAVIGPDGRLRAETVETEE